MAFGVAAVDRLQRRSRFQAAPLRPAQPRQAGGRAQLPGCAPLLRRDSQGALEQLFGVPVRAEGWITRARRRIVDTEGHIVDATTGIKLAKATGVYVAADPARKRDLRKRYAYRPAETDGATTATDPPRPVDALR